VNTFVHSSHLLPWFDEFLLREVTKASALVSFTSPVSGSLSCVLFPTRFGSIHPFVAVCKKLLDEYPDVYVFLGARDASRGKEAVLTLCRSVPGIEGRIELVVLDVSKVDSVVAAASQIPPLYGIVNNAAVGFGLDLEETLATNYWGVRHICDAFLPLLKTASESQPARIVNVGGGKGPMFLAQVPSSQVKDQLSQPWTILSVGELDALASRSNPPEVPADQTYGYSKALLAAYTYQLSRDHPTLVVNTVTPGFVATDMSNGFGATKPPSDGAEPIVRLLMSDEYVGIPQGRYYGSDARRSPLDSYRKPGDPEYEGPDGSDQEEPGL
jgi:carbonyl reductase 1